jgi:hypothetical protein
MADAPVQSGNRFANIKRFKDHVHTNFAGWWKQEPLIPKDAKDESSAKKSLSKVGRIGRYLKPFKLGYNLRRLRSAPAVTCDDVGAFLMMIQ